MAAIPVSAPTTSLFRVSSPNSRNLLIVNKGPGAITILREGNKWDLLEIYFMKADIETISLNPSLTDAEHVVFETDRSMRKFAILKTVFEKNDFWHAYDNFFIADDDLIPIDCSITDIFNLFKETGCRIGQPSLTQDSFFSHIITIKNNNFIWRKTNFVEVMCPIMNREALIEYLPIFNETVSGFGLDDYWSYHEWMKGNGVAILDKTPVRHCRPIGSSLTYEGLSTDTECLSFMERRDIPRYPHSCFGGVPLDIWANDKCRLGLYVSGYNPSFTKDKKYVSYITSETSIYMHTCLLEISRGHVANEQASVHREAVQQFLNEERIEAEKLLDEYWESTSWKLTRFYRNFMRWCKGQPIETKPKVNDLFAIIQIINEIKESASWKILAPARFLISHLKE